MSVEQLLRQFVTALEATGTPYMLTGSHASSLHSVPRMSYDIDFVISPTRSEILSLVRQLKDAGCYVDERAALEALDTHGQFNAIDKETGLKADFIIRKTRPFSETEFNRRRPAELYDVPLIVATAEDVLIAKMEWAKLGESARQIEDAAAILKHRAGALDRTYIEEWVGQLRLQAQWEAVNRSAGVG
ncbi:MAG TPA: hypothetical protein VFJ16_17265 [Longimicrobium sp.]|nr:hypothetical protein [Longimicrobium sp.]